MRQGTGYAYGDSEDCISYKCEGCGQRVRVTPIQARNFRGAFTVCSRDCVFKARARRIHQGHMDREAPERRDRWAYDEAHASGHAGADTPLG